MKDGDSIKALGLLNDITANYWKDVRDAHKNNKKIAYVNATFPVELLYAMDVIPVYPENHAVAIEAKKQSVEITQVAEAAGYPMGMCSYALCDIGSVLSGKSPIGGMPKPDFILHCNAQCDHITKWFEVLCRHYKVPFFLLDAVYVRKEIDEDAVNYFFIQLEDLISFLEEQTGKSFDIDRFREVLTISQKTCDLWNAILGSAANIPSSITFFDQLIAMAPIVTQRGTKVAMEYYGKLKVEIDERVKNKIASIPGEKYRLYWDNLPIWYKLRGLSMALASYKACLVTAMYTEGWGYHFDTSDPIRSMAENYIPIDVNTGDLEYRANKVVNIMDRYHLNGFIIHSNRSCKRVSIGQLDLKNMIVERTGINGIILDADHGDPRFYADERVNMLLETYFDTLEEKL